MTKKDKLFCQKCMVKQINVSLQVAHKSSCKWISHRKLALNIFIM